MILYFFDFSLMIGSFNSVPNKDHVPQLKNTKSSSSAGAAAKAHWVSCPATATTFAFGTPNSSQISSRNCPITVPVGTISFNIFLGIGKLSIISSDHWWVLASNS